MYVSTQSPGALAAFLDVACDERHFLDEVRSVNRLGSGCTGSGVINGKQFHAAGIL